MKNTGTTKRFAALALALVMGSSLAACGNNAQTSNNGAIPVPSAQGNVSPDGAITQTFKQAMTEDGI